MRFVRTLSRASLSLVMIAALSSVALADDVEGAKRAFMEGKKSYNVGEYERAIDSYKEGYSLSPRPDFLYNIGQCYYQLKNWERAKFFYERYISEAPDASDAEEVRGILRELDDRLAAGDTGSGARGPGPGDDRGRPDDRWDDRPPDDRGPGPEPVAVAATGHPSKAFLIAVSAGAMLTNWCGSLGAGYDCFLDIVGDFNIRLWDPAFMTMYLDIQAAAFTDGTESGLSGGVGARVRLDKWWRFVPYALFTFNVGAGGYMGSTTFRPNARFAVGGEFSLRNATGRGVGFFVEVGGGAGSCRFLGGGGPCYSPFSAYQYGTVSGGVSF
jgi:hypothetical protein